MKSTGKSSSADRLNMRALALLTVVLFGGAVCAQVPWKRHVIDNSSQGADGVRLADFNRDGRLDIVTGWEQGNITRVYLQPPHPQVRDRWPAVTVGAAESVEDAVAVDLDGDGHLDVVSSTEGRSRTLFVHWAPSTDARLLDEASWKTQAIPDSVNAQSWMYCLPLQVDGKRGIDLVTGSKSRNAAVGWWESPADPRKLADWKFHPLIDAGWIMSLFARDVDQDGDVDILLTDRRSPTRGLKWLETPDRQDVASPDAWKTHVIGATGKEVMFAALGDLDQDGAEDIITMTRNSTIEMFRRLPRNSVPTWQQYTIPNPHGYPHGKSITIADLDRDGRPDLATTLRCVPKTGPAVAMLRHDGDPFRDKWKTTDIGGPDGSKFDLIEPIDLDGDGDLDLVTCEEAANLGVCWYENPIVAAEER